MCWWVSSDRERSRLKQNLTLSSQFPLVPMEACHVAAILLLNWYWPVSLCIPKVRLKSGQFVSRYDTLCISYTLGVSS